MSVSVTMPRLGESVSEGTVTRWLKSEGDHVEADEPLLEVSTDKVDTEIPAPASGVLSAIKVGEDETVDVGAELATISDGDGGGGSDQSAPAQEPAAEPEAKTPEKPESSEQAAASEQAEASEKAATPEQAETPEKAEAAEPAQAAASEAAQVTEPEAAPAPGSEQQDRKAAAEVAPPEPAPKTEPPTPQTKQSTKQPARTEAAQPVYAPPASDSAESDAGQAAYVTPLVRKLAAEHSVDLGSVAGTGVGGRIRKQDVLDAARTTAPAEEPTPEPARADQPGPSATPPAQQPAKAAAANALRGRTEKMSRLRTVIADRMVESLRVSAQLTTVVEADVTRIARLRQRSKADFQAREGVSLSFLPFFALATIDALKAHPHVNASIDVDEGTITYHDAEHLGIAVDTQRGLLVPVIHSAGDLNLGGLARKIADLADRTRTGKVSPDELGGGTFTLTNTGSRGALFDTPIINQPQVGILGTGSVVKRPVVVDDPDLGEVITVRSMAYLALTYDHRLVDGADAARFLTTVKERLEAGAFEAALGI